MKHLSRWLSFSAPFWQILAKRPGADGFTSAPGSMASYYGLSPGGNLLSMSPSARTQKQKGLVRSISGFGKNEVQQYEQSNAQGPPRDQ